MVITVEPGCYFNASLLEPALKDPAKAKYLNAEGLARFMVGPSMLCTSRSPASAAGDELTLVV